MSFLQGASSTSDLTTYTFSAQNLGTEDAKRHIIVCVQSRRAAATPTISSATINGVSATIVMQTNSGGTYAGIIIAAVPTGTSGDIVVTFDSGMLRCRIAAYSLLLDSATAYDTVASSGDNPVSSLAALDIPSGGEGIGCGAVSYDTSATSWSWSVFTENDDAVLESFLGVTSASSSTPGTGITATATPSGTGSVITICGVFASWTLAVASSGSSHYYRQQEALAL